MKYLFLSILIIFSGCSTKKLFKEKKSKKVSKINYGPSKKSSKFIDATSKYGLSGVRATRAYVYDINGDGLEDLAFLNGNYSGVEFYLATKTKGFQKAKNIYFNESINASFLQFGDFNKDGVVDVVVGIHNQKSALSKQPVRGYFGSPTRDDGIVFRSRTSYNFKFIAPITSVNIFDHDNDGELDFFISSWFDRSRKGVPVENRLFSLKKGKLQDVSFKLVDELKKVGDSYINIAPTFSSSVCDINNDGFPDILTSNTAGYQNKLWVSSLNSGVVTYHDEGKYSGYAQDQFNTGGKYNGGLSTFSICGDYNNDGYYDIASGEISHSHDLEYRDRSSILTNKGHKKISFLRTEYTNDQSVSNWNQGDNRGLWSDLNNDGLIDLIVDNSGFPPYSRLISFVQESNHELVNQAVDYGIDIVNPNSTVIIDVNGDGRNDILTIQTNTRDFRITPRVFLFENQLPQKNFLKLKLVGTKSNSDAIGANIILTTTSGNVYTRQHFFSFGHLQPQSSSFVHFGLANEGIKKLEVEWPIIKNGRRYRKTYDVLINELNTIRE